MFKKYLQTFLKNFEKRAARIEKRIRLVISVIILSALLLFSTFFYFDKALYFIPVLFIGCIGLSYFAMLEDIKKMEWFGLFLMPTALTVFFYIFYFLFPGRWLTRLPFMFIYGISIYAILLCSNIFNVGVEKSLRLYRAAFSINFFYQSFLVFIIFNILFSLKELFFINMIVVGGVAFIFSLQLFWTIKLDQSLSKELVDYSLLMTILLAELALVISFIPLKSTIAALFLTASYYSLGGVVYNYIDQKLFKETIREYIFVWFFVLIIVILSISW